LTDPAGLVRAAEARTYTLANATDLPRIDRAALVAGPQTGVCFIDGDAPELFWRNGPEFLDDPDGVGLFAPQQVGRAPYESPPDFAAGIGNAVLAGYRSFLNADGRFFSDEVYYEPEVAQRQRDRLARPDPFSNECTGLTPMGDGQFTFAQGDRPTRKIDGTVAVLLSDEPLSYGSFLFRFLPKVQTLRRLGLEGIRVLTHPPSDSCRTLLRLAGIPGENVIEHDLNAVTVIDRAIVPGLRNPNTFFAPESCELFAELRKAHGPAERTRRLYISRYGINADGWSTRVMRNEAELIARLATLGFEAIEPENMPVEDQIAAFASAAIVVGPSGSGMFNSIFCHPGTKLIDIQSEPQWIYSYTGMYSSLGLRWGIFVGKADVIPDQPHHRPWDVNIDALIVRVEAFLKA